MGFVWRESLKPDPKGPWMTPRGFGFCSEGCGDSWKVVRGGVMHSDVLPIEAEGKMLLCIWRQLQHFCLWLKNIHYLDNQSWVFCCCCCHFILVASWLYLMNWMDAVQAAHSTVPLHTPFLRPLRRQFAWIGNWVKVLIISQLSKY